MSSFNINSKAGIKHQLSPVKITSITDDSVVKGTNVVPPQSFVHIHQLDLIMFLKLTTCKEQSTNKQNVEINSLIFL